MSNEVWIEQTAAGHVLRDEYGPLTTPSETRDELVFFASLVSWRLVPPPTE